ncbi:uncharacterized protein EI90DRAFT_3083512 [Cantharellus anzutake]|uniref:uncharacterized protein n=1 Tax=Cantharellus anzutake TaxID=1750568 RepID=UPI001903B336|nr:uncharacterized protein EI90DRAFT_3083512 [Cantharellus anzutake]KAF8318566.1 hypothetical protein EI90DRAFT_3083512 [Cantharellus anzutake]
MIVHLGLDALEAHASEAHGKARQNASIEWHVTSPSTDGFWGLETTAVHKFQLSVRHKLFEKHATLEPVRMPSFRKLTLAEGIVSTGPGWFCPYVYSTHRQPLVSRINEISFVQLREPIIAADQILAFQLVGFFKSIFGRLISFVNPSPTFQPPKTPSTSRALVCIAGISPFRGLWSQGRRPDQCKMWFHIMNGVPGIAIPVVDSSPLLAWHGKDLGELEMQDLAEVVEYVSTLLDPAYQIDLSTLNAALECMIGNAIAGRKAAKKLDSDFDLDRTGILVIKYGTAAVTV